LSARKRLVDRYGTRLPSRRQLRVIELVAQGLKNKEIAKELRISEHVVRNHLGKIYDKIGVSNRVELALWYWARRQERKPRRTGNWANTSHEEAGRSVITGPSVVDSTWRAAKTGSMSTMTSTRPTFSPTTHTTAESSPAASAS